MNASEFARKRAAINRRAKGREAFARKALAHLVREARAVPHIAGGKVTSYVMSDGSVACVKHRYRDQLTANLELARIAQYAIHAYLPVRSYSCHWCRGFHLTSKAENNPSLFRVMFAFENTVREFISSQVAMPQNQGMYDQDSHPLRRQVRR